MVRAYWILQRGHLDVNTIEPPMDLLIYRYIDYGSKQDLYAAINIRDMTLDKLERKAKAIVEEVQNRLI